MPTLRTWMGNIPHIVTGRLVRDTGSGLIIESNGGIRYFAFQRDVLPDITEPKRDDLFAPLENMND